MNIVSLAVEALSVTVNPSSLPASRITKIATGSSHSIDYAQGNPAAATEFSPVTFLAAHDPLGSSVASAKPEESKEVDEKKRPSLTKIILSLDSLPKQQDSLAHMLTALQITYARDTIVNALSGVVTARARVPWN